jgi:hypothetical protein
MLFKVTFIAYSENQSKHIDSLYGRSAGFLYYNMAYRNHWDLKVTDIGEVKGGSHRSR